jgi:hypothetical protein
VPNRLIAAIAMDDPTRLVEQLRNDLADVLREQADDEQHPCVPQRLRDIADAFESGAGQPDGVINTSQQHDGSYAPHAPIAHRAPLTIQVLDQN